MLKKSFLFLIVLCSYGLAFAQNIDSVQLVHAKWSKQRVARKVKLITHHFNAKDLFLANQNISYLEIRNRGKSPVLAIGAEEKVLKTTSTFGEEHKALAAVNGSFFDVKNGGSVDFIKVEGKVLAENQLERNGKRAKHQQAALVIEAGKLALKKWDGSADWEHNLREENVLLTGPLLVLNGQDEVLDSSSFSRSRHPRTAIGIKANGRIVLLTVDGRNANAAGMSLTELARTMKWLGCSSSINLDGGGSTTLWISGFPDGGVVNYPSDNKLWDHAGQRKVANVILVKKI
ncbi:phosphodiester glycosidase family protein [Pedobacter heparinus]|uniref:phosphodiester glycosidase family protein n=1 Tax=Pedobacter heparinus TaxID=984 RepID=UPI0029318BC4|nr:phosphodiester glycosidase family protein [Pedobacter heparinus]